MEFPKRYPYAFPWSTMIWCGVLFGGLAAVLAYAAAEHRTRLVFFGLDLGPLGTTIVLWILCGFSAFFVVVVLSAGYERLTKEELSLDLHDDAVFLPYGWMLRKTARVPYAEIERIEEVRVNGNDSLHLRCRGQTYAIHRHMLPDPAAYQILRDFLRERAGRG